MFRVTAPEHIDLTVRAGPPGQPQGTFTVRVKYLPTSRRRALLAELGEGSSDERDTRVFHDLVVGWEGLEQEDGGLLEYSAEALGQVLEIDYLRRAISQAILRELLTGEVDRKNSEAPAAIGQSAGLH